MHMMHMAAGARRRTVVVTEPDVPVLVADAWYVATTGSDAAAGTQAAPFLTLQQAVTSASAHGTRKTIYVRGGTYRMTASITLNSSCANLNILGYPGEIPVLSGGTVVTGFASEGNGLYSATLGTATSLDLVIGGERQRVAQTGNWDPSDPYRSGWFVADSVATGSETTNQFKYRNTDIASVTLQTGLMAYVLEGSALRATSVEIVKPVSSINTTTKVVTLSATTAGASPIYTNSSYRLMNHPAFIQNTGEFAWNGTLGKLVIKPKSTNFASLGVAVPTLQFLFHVETGANNVTVSNLTFSEIRQDGFVFNVYGGTGLRVGGCTFKNVGNGFQITSGNSNVIAGNTFLSVANSGIFLGSNVLGTKIYGNTFKDIGAVHPVGSCIYQLGASNSYIAYNDVFGAGRYFSATKGAATAGHTFHRCSNNWVMRTNRETSDTGAIEYLNRNRVTLNATVSGNYIDDSGGFTISGAGAYEDRKYASSVYLDDLSSFVTISGNFMRGAAWGQVFIHGGDDNTIQNNIHIIESHETYVSTMHANGNLTGDVTPERNTFQRNIYYSATTRTGTMWNTGGLGTGNVINNNIYHNIPMLSGFDANSTVADPLFADAPAGNFVLQGGSPAFGKSFVNLEWTKMGRGGYTESVATAETLPQFWRAWTDTPFIDFNYQTRPGLYNVETFTRATGATYINARGVRVAAVANQPRFDFDPATMEPLGLLLEDATTNLIANSGDFTNVAWTKTNATATASGGGTGLDGANSLSVLTKTTEQGKALTYVNTFPAGSHLTASVYLKKGASMDWVAIELTDNSFVSGKTVWFNLATGVAGAAPSGGTTMTYVSHGITHMGKGIYKCTLTVLTNTITDATLQIWGDTGDGGYWGVVGGTTLLAGAQVEAKDHATSLVITTSAPVSRAADILTIPSTAVSGLTFSGGEGSLVVDVALLQPANSTAATILSIDDGDTNPASSDRVEVSRTAGGAALFSVVTNGTAQTAISGGSLSPSSATTIAGAWKSNDAIALVEGTATGTDTSVTIPSGLSKLTLGGRSATGGGVASGHYKRLQVYSKRMGADAMKVAGVRP